MSLSRMYTPVLHFDDINGRPLVGGKLYTYEANSSTPAPTYRDKSGTLLNENPISLDERGECEVWLVDGLRYKMVLVDPIGTQVWEADDVSSSGSGSSSLRRINIFSSDHSVDVDENYVAQNDSFNVDLGVKFENLPDKPDIPPAQVNSDWNANSGVAQILNKPDIPPAQVNSDWNANSGVAQILNKPDIPPAQVNSDWNANSGVAQILNKPDIHGSCLLTPRSEWQTLDGTSTTLTYIWSSGTPSAVTGDKIRLATTEGHTKYRVEVAALGAYRIDGIIHVKWEGTPVNKTGSIYGFACDFSRNFTLILGRQPVIVEIPYNQKPYYGFGFPVPDSYIDAPNGVKLAIQILAEYLGPVPEAT